jgi:ribosomal protein S18 acetylase RimI-like enzyme
VSLHLLDNPIWSSLTTDHAHFARLVPGSAHAHRYPAQVAPFAAVPEPGAAPARELAGIVDAGESIYVVGVAPEFDNGWTLLSCSKIVQMVWQRQADVRTKDGDIVRLSGDDSADMVDLTTLAFPGFFRPQTPQMGRYFGIRRDGMLVAMAGERMSVTGYREISAVCTHPQFTGQGYAARLVLVLVDLILELRRVPYLHVGEGNARARALYRRLGFVDRCELPMWLVQRGGT